MYPAANLARARTAVAAAAAATALLMAGCGPVVPSLDDLSGNSVSNDPFRDRMTIHAPFDEVWPEVVTIVEQRGYAEVEFEQGAAQETYRTVGAVENQPRDKEFRETVTEKNGRIVATTAGGRLVPLALQEQHEWDMSVLDRMAAVSGGSERYRLEHDGVEIVPGEADWTRIDREELEALFGAIRARFERDST